MAESAALADAHGRLQWRRELSVTLDGLAVEQYPPPGRSCTRRCAPAVN
ncbi:hypothetical protein NKH77_19325 [Streptomyces sp. M19]